MEIKFTVEKSVYFLEVPINGRSKIFRSMNPDHRIMWQSSRIWKLDLITNQVRYIKNRYKGSEEPVNPKEFVLIQLKADNYEFKKS